MTTTFCTCPPNVQCPAVRPPYGPNAPAYCEHCDRDMDTTTNAAHPFTEEHVEECDECARTLSDEALVVLGLLL